jgi:hypothetical protein
MMDRLAAAYFIYKCARAVDAWKWGWKVIEFIRARGEGEEESDVRSMEIYELVGCEREGERVTKYYIMKDADIVGEEYGGPVFL